MSLQTPDAFEAYYLDLAAQARVADGRPRPVSPRQALADLVLYARRHGPLPMSNPWELAPRESRRIETELGYAPVGAWNGLLGLAAGTGLFVASEHGFEYTGVDPWLDDSRCRLALLEAFTCMLSPPIAAAALYVALDVHPMWGLRLGEAVGAIRGEVTRRSDLLADGGLASVRTAVFGTLAAFIAALRGLDARQEYPVDALAGLFGCCAAAAAARARAEHVVDDRLLPVFVHDETEIVGSRMASLAVLDIVDTVFVPAGTLRRYDDGWFCIEPQALSNVTVGPYDVKRQQELFSRATGSVLH